MNCHVQVRTLAGVPRRETFLCFTSLLCWNFHLLPSLSSSPLSHSLQSKALNAGVLQTSLTSSLWGRPVPNSSSSVTVFGRISKASVLVVSYSWWSSSCSRGNFQCVSQCQNIIPSQMCAESCVAFMGWFELRVKFAIIATVVLQPSSSAEKSN